MMFLVNIIIGQKSIVMYNSNYKSIKNWISDDRPREKLEKLGPENLTDSELLAILIGSGAKGFSAVDAGRELLTLGESISKVANFNIEQIQKIKGLGPAKAITLKAAFELAKRIKFETTGNTIQITSPDILANIYIPRFYGENQEMFFVILLNSSNIIIKEKMIAKGTLNNMIIHPRDIFKFAIDFSAASIILLHNHPSGNTTASQNDIKTTENLIKIGKIMDILIVDHLIIAGDSFQSMRSTGIVDFD